MTYCVGMLLRQGLVMVSDSRTNAGVDHVSTFRKMTVWEVPGERVITLMTAGNLAISQGVVTMLNEGLADDPSDQPVTMENVESMTEAARLVGKAVRAVERIDGPALKAHGVSTEASMILGGQIRGRKQRLFLIYSAGNFIEATAETVYFQIGETKYGKPVIDRIVKFDTSLEVAAKCALVSMDSTMRSNISVGPPIDVVLCERDALRLKTHVIVEDNDSYFQLVRRKWEEGLSNAFAGIPSPDWPDARPIERIVAKP
jgi:putative proteasome-type protease